MNFAITNARSVSAKATSVVENFKELDLHFMTISETWLRKGRVMKDFTEQMSGEGIGGIYRNRESRGGGVAILYDTNKLVLKEAFRLPSQFEVVCAVGKCTSTNKRVVVISLYIPPKTDAASLLRLKIELKDKLEIIKQEVGDYDVYIGGDTNRRPIDDCFENFPEIKRLDAGPTRGDALLDVCYTNANEYIVDQKTCQALEDEEGIKSDHRVSLFKYVRQRFHKYTTTEFTTRKYSPDGESKFGTLFNQVDWSPIDTMTPDEAVDLLNSNLDEINDACFPLRKHKVRSCDKPWITRRIKRLIRRKKRAFKRTGKNDRWKDIRNFTESEILDNKTRFLGKVRERVRTEKNPKAFFSAIRMLKSEETTKKWSISSMFPGKDDDFIAKTAAEFFNRISSEFTPLPAPNYRDQTERCPTVDQILARIKTMKKPASYVEGDVDRRILIKYPDILAPVLHRIYLRIYKTNIWPGKWKRETVSLLPKNRAPDSLSQLRNISCTPFFSKLLESFVLESLKKKVKLGDNQYGGKKGQGVNHMLIEIWDEIQSGLENKNTAINLTAIDFEKAFLAGG